MVVVVIVVVVVVVVIVINNSAVTYNFDLKLNNYYVELILRY